jgi:hypothetical protein
MVIYSERVVAQPGISLDIHTSNRYFWFTVITTTEKRGDLPVDRVYLDGTSHVMGVSFGMVEVW